MTYFTMNYKVVDSVLLLNTVENVGQNVVLFHNEEIFSTAVA